MVSEYKGPAMKELSTAVDRDRPGREACWEERQRNRPQFIVDELEGNLLVVGLAAIITYRVGNKSPKPAERERGT